MVSNVTQEVQVVVDTRTHRQAVVADLTMQHVVTVTTWNGHTIVARAYKHRDLVRFVAQQELAGEKVCYCGPNSPH